MDVFDLHKHVVDDYANYTNSFIRISDERIAKAVQQDISEGLLWPEPLLQLNPSFASGKRIDQLISEGLLHEDCGRIFRIKRDDNDMGRELRLHIHQEQAIRKAAAGEPYVLTTGTGSGKSLSYIVPIVDHVLRSGSGSGIKAIVVYPMNALANSQREELDKFLTRGFGEGQQLVTFARYTGQEGEQERERILNHPPDILLTNYVMLELILTRIEERRLVEQARTLRFLVFDELHTYRGRQGADVAMLVRRCREAFQSQSMRCVGTSATMASTGDSVEQARVVATVVSQIFGEEVPTENVIGETLRRTTNEYDFQSPDIVSRLQATIESPSKPDTEYDAFREQPLASWIEETFGLRREEGTDKLVRQTPQPLKGDTGVATKLAELTGCNVEACEAALQTYLYAGSECRDPETNFPVFAFRLHQFITRGDTAWASLESEDERIITLRGQQFVPGDRNKVLLPLVFCRHCGHPYYRVDRPTHGQESPVVPREDFGRTVSVNVESGYLYLSATNPWPEDAAEWVSRVPEDWVEQRRGGPVIKRNKPVPELMSLGTTGEPEPNGLRVAFVKAPFQFCLNPECGVAYNARQSSDVSKLATIGVDGRSTATTILALSTILKLRVDESLDSEAKKLLSFTDNRQDASLQAGHFNDFVEVGLIRSALYRAMTRIGEEGLRYDDLVHHVERALDLPAHLFANDPELRGPALEESRRALRSVLAYYLYRDLERGWRVTSPNLEQCGLLFIDYLALDEVAADKETWESPNSHAVLAAASVEQRIKVIRVLLDHLRRSLIIKEDSLNFNYQERISDQSRQRLREPWVIEIAGDMVKAGVAWPRSRMDRERQEDLCISPRSNFGQLLKRELPNLGESLRLEDLGDIILALFRCLKPWGLVEEVRSPRDGSQVPGYQLPASVMQWKPGDGSQPMFDPLRITHQSETDNTGNDYFTELYKSFADLGSGLEGREHTAQVQADVRQEREEQFRRAELPILFCSPTMELGVDIAQLNVVNMRNVPPTPANYAQRSGRAGRGGQPALVYTYCSGFSPHDKYYFRHPERMVAGAVTAPRLDLLNRDLVEAHVHATWLSEAKLNLGTTLAELLVVSEEDLSLPLNDRTKEVLVDAGPKLRAQQRARRLLESIGPELRDAPWYRDDWLDDVLTRLPQRFDEACNRWRSLYKAAVQQRQHQNRIIGDHSRTQIDRDRAKRLRAQAETQIALLTNSQNAFEGDFYSYRYFASEGFLPGYNFPRLPLSAFIPARRGRRGKDEFLSRPRFLAISEYGPRAVIYHEGSRYRINKVNLAFDEDSQEITQYVMKVCSDCGYGHFIESGPGVDNCENCGRPLEPTDEIRDMVRLQNVTAKRADRITSDEEERQRVGYEIRSTFRFSTVNGEPDFRKAEVKIGEGRVATMRYGDAAEIWRINVGWRKRRHENEHGFLLDVERGYWASNRDVEDNDTEDPMNQARVKRVVPYVQDNRNALTFELETRQNVEFMATLQAAIKQGIQQVYQLEPNELAVDPLPSPDDRRILFFYEASEGGAGVLRQVAEEPNALAEVARAALNVCHFNPETGEDEGGDDCEAACYDCLLEYGNQPDHRSIDRSLVANLLLELTQAVTEVSGSRRTRADHLDELMRACDSQLERRWLQQVHQSQLRLPTHAQHLISSCSTRPDFYYNGVNTVVYIDGPVHDEPDQKAEDEAITDRLMDAGYLVIRFHHAADWNAIFDQYADVFGQRRGV
ncbi:DEAD/DEAH box helicase [Aeoliella mucimassa]|uniref:Putative ATP-dependent helicase Lhr n=1 Tax=Aeoliella mucimassa TaxID=2527972 RepID=A0A518APS4_9BACT|nr:DEAD/DEAH box helicase [Aeoliella mucimassa]QDU56729.1 putative ATP-dependent helicase Lhr [Aeoliella mucimassa]